MLCTHCFYAALYIYNIPVARFVGRLADEPNLFGTKVVNEDAVYLAMSVHGTDTFLKNVP